MKFTEEKLEKAFTELLGQEGFTHQHRITIARKPDEVLIEDDLKNFLLTQYASHGITVNEVKSIILQLKSLPASDLYESNKTFLRMLSDGFILKQENRNQKDIYRFVNQLEIVGTEKRIPDGIDSMFTLIQGMFHKNRLRDIIRNFIYIPDSSKKNEKIVCRYPQYYAARALYDNIKKAQKPEGNGKGGTYFGATGCGKSFTMLYLARLLMKSEFFESPTIVIITDRTDLDDQLSAQFVNAKNFISDNTVESVESRADLRDKLQGRQSGGVFLTTIHKFTEDTELLTSRSNVICISDEAHLSQVNLDQKVRVTDKGVTKSFGFAKYLHDFYPMPHLLVLPERLLMQRFTFSER